MATWNRCGHDGCSDGIGDFGGRIDLVMMMGSGGMEWMQAWIQHGGFGIDHRAAGWIHVCRIGLPIPLWDVQL